MVRRIAIVTAAVLVAGLIGLTLRSTDTHRQRIAVRWTPGLTASERISIETRFGLEDPAIEDAQSQTWTYAPASTARRALKALVDHPSVADTAGIIRGTGQIEGPIGAVDRIAAALPRAAALALMLGSAFALVALLKE